MDLKMYGHAYNRLWVCWFCIQGARAHTFDTKHQLETAGTVGTFTVMQQLSLVFPSLIPS